MRPQYRLEPQRNEQRLQELRRERKAETTRVERLSATLAKKTVVKAPGLAGKAA